MTGFGLYGSSRYARSSSVNSTFRAPTIVWSALRIPEGSLVLTNHLPEVIQLGSTNDGGSDLLRAPGKCDLGHLDPLLIGEFLDTRVPMLDEQPSRVTMELLTGRR